MSDPLLPANENYLGWAYIEITSGTVTDAHVEGAEGVRPIPELIGRFQFFVDAVDAKGGRLALHSCDDHATATALAREACNALEVDFDLIRDSTVGEPSRWRHIELCAGLVTSARIETQDVFFDITEWEDTHRYFVYAIDADGEALGLGTFEDYQDAVDLAERTRAQYGVTAPVRNRIAEAH